MTGKCLLFFYKLNADNITIRLTITSEHLEDVIVEDLHLPYSNEIVIKHWMPHFSVLPDGIHHIKLTTFAVGQVEAFIDDFSIRPCYDFSELLACELNNIISSSKYRCQFT